MTFQGEKHDALPHTVHDSKWSGQLMGWLASLTLEDEGRHDLGIPQVVCEYKDAFPDELPGLPLHRDVDFVIKLHPDTSPISMTLLGWYRLSCRNSRSNFRNCWIRVLLDQTLHHGALRFCLLRRKRLFECALIIDS